MPHKKIDEWFYFHGLVEFGPFETLSEALRHLQTQMPARADSRMRWTVSDMSQEVYRLEAEVERLKEELEDAALRLEAEKDIVFELKERLKDD